MTNVSKIIFAILFADDTSLFLQGKTIDQLIKTMNAELKNISEWLQVNKLSLNVKKTTYMIFTKRNIICLPHNVTINSQIIQRVYVTKFLGVMLDPKLIWEPHIHYVRNKISKGIGIIAKARKVLKLPNLQTLYYCFIYPHLIYCNEVWGSASKIHILSLLKLQKKAVRIVTSSSFKEHTAPLFSKLSILSLEKLHSFSIIIFMFKYVNGKLPSMFKDMFTLNKNVHDYPTRQADKFHIPKCRTTLAHNSLRFIGILLWNTIIDKIQYKCALQTFKKNLKSYLDKHDFIVV
jgi:hypothetical protein